MGEPDLALPIGSDTVKFQVERVQIEPFNLRHPTKYDVVLDRLTHWLSPSREWIKKAVIMDGLYVLNNPWSVQAMEKQTSYCAMMRLGLPIPETWMIPPKARPGETVSASWSGPFAGLVLQGGDAVQGVLTLPRLTRLYRGINALEKVGRGEGIMASPDFSRVAYCGGG